MVIPFLLPLEFFVSSLSSLNPASGKRSLMLGDCRILGSFILSRSINSDSPCIRDPVFTLITLVRMKLEARLIIASVVDADFDDVIRLFSSLLFFFFKGQATKLFKTAKLNAGSHTAAGQLNGKSIQISTHTVTKSF